MKKILLIILDGYGIAPPSDGNGITLAQPSTLNSLNYLYPHTQLSASGESVGLPKGEPGNTEVGHLNIGAGRVVFQSLSRINMAIADGTFYKVPAFLQAIKHVHEHKSQLHLLGLVGEGTVHASIEHLYALLYLVHEHKIKDICIHVITDGRDSPPKSALTYLHQVQEKIDQLKVGHICTIMGRYYGMDRDRRWERTEKAYRCLTEGSENVFKTWKEAINESYERNITDEFIEPLHISVNGKINTIKSNDAIIFFNYRIDRPRQLTKAFVLDNFSEQANIVEYDPYATKYYKKHNPQDDIINKPFIRKQKLDNLYFVTLTEYEKNLPVHVAFSPSVVTNPIGMVYSEHQVKQLRIAESEKERFVTYYFNGLRAQPFTAEDRLIVPSAKVPTYDQKPEMSAYEITKELTQKMIDNIYPFITVNFANPDMVGHTGNLHAVIEAIKHVDSCISTIIKIAEQTGYTVLITADHGNAEQMIDNNTQQIYTEHTSNKVPFILVDPEFKGKPVMLPTGILADIAPTILSLVKIPIPTDMTGRNLIEELQRKNY